MNTPGQLVFDYMQLPDLDEVMSIETAVYPHPWSKGNFVDSLRCDYDAWVVRRSLCPDGILPESGCADNQLLGYFLQMPVVDEMHLLNVAVAGAVQGQGIGVALLTHMAANARLREMESVLLEVRASNQRAIAIYQEFGFAYIGRRKAYYPAGLTPDDPAREDALVMRLMLRHIHSS